MVALPRLMKVTIPCLWISFVIVYSEAFSSNLFPEMRIKYASDDMTLFSSSRRKGAMSRRRREEKSKGSGFGSESHVDTDEDNSDSEPTVMPKQKAEKARLFKEESSDDIYSFPALYDLAFGYRSYEEEVEFLLQSHKRHNGIESDDPLRILELAAGPGRHSIAALNQDQFPVQVCTAIDISPDMASYSKELAAHELLAAHETTNKFQYHVDDMRKLKSLKSGEQYDTAWLLLGSMAHLITNKDVVDCFRSTAQVLKEGGTFILELAHPRETFSMVDCTKNSWTVPLQDDSGDNDLFGELSILWGDDNDEFDPIRQVRDFTVSMELKENANDKIRQKVKEIVPMRLFTSQEIDALAQLSGFHLVEMFGALDENVDIDSDEEAYRLVCILKK